MPGRSAACCGAQSSSELRLIEDQAAEAVTARMERAHAIEASGIPDMDATSAQGDLAGLSERNEEGASRFPY
ncbi:MAG: hypothetical protein WDO56_12415 [Gammaproteobacteria bacterium]